MSYIDFSAVPVKCPICKEQLLKLNRSHAISHGYKSLKDFKAANKIEYETLLQRSMLKVKELYNIDYSRWGMVYWNDDGDWHYTTKQYFSRDDSYRAARQLGIMSANRYPLANSAFKRHFTGDNPLAVFAYGTHSRYFGFDIDTKDQALQHTIKLVHTLKEKGIAKEDIHVSYSGSKGYHIEIFTEPHILFNDWNLLGQYIVNEAGLTGQAIEFRPESKNGRAWKLPLTFHHKTGKFAGFVDKETYEILGFQESHDYLFGITPTTGKAVFKLIQQAKEQQEEIKRQIEEEKERQRQAEREKKKAVQITDKRVFQTNNEKRESTKKYLTQGLVEKGTRHNVTMSIALYLYYEQGNDIDTVRDMLIDWTKKQIGRGMTDTPIAECTEDIEKVLEWVDCKSWGFGTKIRDLEITRAELDWVLSIDKRSPRDLLWALLLRQKAYARSNGTFFTSDRDLQKLLATPRTMSFNTIGKWRQWLIKNSYITADIPTDSYLNRKATVYKLLYEPPTGSNIIDSIDFNDDIDCRKLLVDIAAKLYTDSYLRLKNLA